MPPIVRTFISPEQLQPGRKVTYDEVANLASSLNKREALEFIAFLNLLLSTTTVSGDLTDKRDVQGWILREIVSESLLGQLKARFGNSSLLDYPFLHRTQLLFLARVVATHGREDGGNTLRERKDFDVIGDLALLVSGLFRLDEAPGGKAATAVWLACQMGPMFETENPPNLGLAIPRMQKLFDRMRGALAGNVVFAREIENLIVSGSGFGFQAWADIGVILYSVWATKSFKELMANHDLAYIDPDRDHEVISKAALSKALEQMAVKEEQLSQHLQITEFTRTSLFDLTPFRSKPLWQFPKRVLCADVGLLAEKLGPHVFWSVMNALSTATQRRDFSAAWGNAFEGYCLDALGQIFRSRKWVYLQNPIDRTTGEELFDGIALRGIVAVVIECKGTFMKSSEKYSGSPTAFFRGLTKKFGNVPHGGIFQLVRGVKRAWQEKSAVVEGHRLDRVKDVFPILVTQDPILGCGPVSRVLSDRFTASIDRAVDEAPGVKVWPLVTLSADDVDLLAAVWPATGLPFEAVLKGFHREYPSRMYSFSDYLRAFGRRKHGISDEPSDGLQLRFREASAQSMARIEAADYGGSRR